MKTQGLIRTYYVSYPIGNAALVFYEVADGVRRGGPKPLTIAERVARFWAKVNIGPPDACWEWQAATFEHGYGMFNVGRQPDGRQIPEAAHRIAYILAHGPIPSGLQVRHDCDNPRCCNPDHLTPGTVLDNMRDKVSRGHSSAPRPKSWVVPAGLVREAAIEHCLVGPRGTIAHYAKQFGVSIQSWSTTVRRERERRKRPTVAAEAA